MGCPALVLFVTFGRHVIMLILSACLWYATSLPYTANAICKKLLRFAHYMLRGKGPLLNCNSDTCGSDAAVLCVTDEGLAR